MVDLTKFKPLFMSKDVTSRAGNETYFFPRIPEDEVWLIESWIAMEIAIGAVRYMVSGISKDGNQIGSSYLVIPTNGTPISDHIPIFGNPGDRVSFRQIGGVVNEGFRLTISGKIYIIE